MPEPVLVRNAYGKTRVRLTKVTRHDDHHDLSELSVDVMLEGDFAASYLDGDNTNVVATDSMKNTVYVLARDFDLDAPEAFALHLARHFVSTYAQVTQATVCVAEDAWSRIDVNGVPHPTAFVGGRAEKRTCVVTCTAGETRVAAGLRDLRVLKTTGSAFRDFVRDRFRTLPDADDRILATSVTAEWHYAPGTHDWNAGFDAVRTAMLDVFARHESLAVQQTLYLMGRAALDACAEVSEITLRLPNSHRIPFNLAPLGRDNPNVIFVPTDEPYGDISGTLKRA